MYTALVSSVLFPLHERLKGHATVAVRRALEKTQWWSADTLERYRMERLRRLLERAARQVPYYRRLFAERSFDPAGVRSAADLSALPFLTKGNIRENLEALKAEDASAGALTLFNTGGSTGEPLQFYLGSERVSHDVAAKWRATRWWGVDIGDPEIVVWGSPIELSAQDRVRELRDRLFRTRLLPAFEMSESRLDEFVDVIARTRPRMVFGYPSSLALVADHARTSGRDLTSLGIRVAFVTAEQLYDHQRASLAAGYGCRVANGYGGRDLGFVAHECPEGGLHVTAEDVLVEIVDPGGRVLPTGEEGEIVVTHFATGEFPFIRYRSGDLGVLSSAACSCGRGLPLLERVSGRTTDFIVARDGTVMHALALIYAIRDVPGVRNFKILQEDIDHTRVLLVTESSFPAAREEAIRKRLEDRLGAGVRISLEKVDEIPKTGSGKHRYVESRVPVSPTTPGSGHP
jgi:phenylacetate-coenzyme A ligase PaaK-like adenylate-forming protein